MKRTNSLLIAISILFYVLTLNLTAQNIGINSTGTAPNTSAMLDVSSTTKGLLIPRVGLTSTVSNLPIGASVVTSLLVYNTATINDVTPGYYYWDATWKRLLSSESSDWKLTGNAGTIVGTNYIGTSDAKDLVFKTNANEQMRINTSGFLGIGITNPQALLHTNGGNVVVIGAAGNIANIGANDLIAATDATEWVINAYATGTSAGAGFFKNSNAANVKPVIDIKNYGTGEGVLSTSFGTGTAFTGQTNTALVTGLFTNNKASANVHVITAQYNGTGTSGDVAVLGTASLAGGGNGTGVRGEGGFTGIYGKQIAGGTYAGYFSGTTKVFGNLIVTGSLTKGAGTFLIDHPLDPDNKYLYHSFVESPDMMNIYNGNAITDDNGDATITLPDYFTTLNIDYRYQLTAIGKFAQVIVLEKIKDNQFKIKSDIPNVEVSWQVTGIRNDPYAQKNRIIPVVEKAPKDKGKYLYPEVYGQPENKRIGFDEEHRADTKQYKTIFKKGKEVDL